MKGFREKGFRERLEMSAKAKEVALKKYAEAASDRPATKSTVAPQAAPKAREERITVEKAQAPEEEKPRPAAEKTKRKGKGQAQAGQAEAPQSAKGRSAVEAQPKTGRSTKRSSAKTQK